LLRGGSDGARLRTADKNAREIEGPGSPACSRSTEGLAEPGEEEGDSAPEAEGPEGPRPEQHKGVIRTGNWAAGREVVFRVNHETSTNQTSTNETSTNQTSKHQTSKHQTSNVDVQLDVGEGPFSEALDRTGGAAGGWWGEEGSASNMQLPLGAAMEQVEKELERERTRRVGGRAGHDGDDEPKTLPPAGPPTETKTETKRLTETETEGPSEAKFANRALAAEEDEDESSLSEDPSAYPAPTHGAGVGFAGFAGERSCGSQIAALLQTTADPNCDAVSVEQALCEVRRELEDAHYQPSLVLNCSQILMQQGHGAQVGEILFRSLRLSPRHLGLLSLHAAWLVSKGDLSAAERGYRKALAIVPPTPCGDYASLLMGLAGVLKLSRESGRVMDSGGEGGGGRGGGRVDRDGEEARRREMLLEEEVDLMRQATVLSPGHAGSWNNLASALYTLAQAQPSLRAHAHTPPPPPPAPAPSAAAAASTTTTTTTPPPPPPPPAFTLQREAMAAVSRAIELDPRSACSITNALLLIEQGYPNGARDEKLHQDQILHLLSLRLPQVLRDLQRDTGRGRQAAGGREREAVTAGSNAGGAVGAGELGEEAGEEEEGCAGVVRDVLESLAKAMGSEEAASGSLHRLGWRAEEEGRQADALFLYRLAAAVAPATPRQKISQVRIQWP
jgi:tetratricopeptide (TPR) repeat protein